MIWIEIIIFIVMFISVVAIMGADMNDRYGKGYDTTLGLNLTSSLSSLTQYQSDIVNDTTGGQASQTDFGIIKLITTPKILLQVTGIMWSFVSGTFIYDLLYHMHLGGNYMLLLGGLFQTLYVLAIAFIFLKIIFKIEI